MPISNPISAQWVLITTGTASASSNVDLLVNSAAYSEWWLCGRNIVMSTSNELALQVGAGGPPTYDTGNTYDFCVSWQYGTTSTGTASRAFVSATANIRIGTVASASSASGVPMNIDCYMNNLASGSNMRLYEGDGNYDGSGGLTETRFFGVHLNAAYDVSGLRLLPSSGTITSGTFALYGRIFP